MKPPGLSKNREHLWQLQQVQGLHRDLRCPLLTLCPAGRLLWFSVQEDSPIASLWSIYHTGHWIIVFNVHLSL